MGLPVVDHLQPMLEAAQKPIVVDQIAGGGRIDAPGRGETAERRASRAHPQLAHPAAPDQLLGLREKLYFTDAAATGFDVMAFDGDSSAAVVGVDLALDRMDILDRGKIQIFSPDEGFQLTQKAPP